MALKPKHPHICVDEKIWDDPVMIGVSGNAFRVYIFAIAWSKSQEGRTPDGILTLHGIGRVGATLEILQELLDSKLLEKCEEGYKILKYEEWQMTSDEVRAARDRAAVKTELGKQAASARWSKTPPPPPEAGFDVEKAFEEAWENWPEPSEARFMENRDEALESFRANITNSKDFAAFSQAIMKRVKEYHVEQKPKAERRRFLGAFKNFCDGKWKSWIPKSYRAEAAPPSVAPADDPEMQAIIAARKAEQDAFLAQFNDLETKTA